MKKINAALIGYGMSGKVFHGPFLKALEGFELCWILTRDPAKQADAALDFPSAKITADESDLWADEALDLVIIATPNVEHHRLAMTAMSKGKHVVVEKPFTVDSAEALELAETSEKLGLCLSVYQNRRWDGDYKTVCELVKSAKLGRLVQFESHFDRFRPEFKENAWREKPLPGSGILFDLGSHLIDQALHLFGRPQSVYADVSAERLGEVDDAFSLTLYYENLKVLLKASCLIKEETPRFALYGTEGAFVIYGLDQQESILKAGNLAFEPKRDGSQSAQMTENPSNRHFENRPQSAHFGILNTLEGRNDLEVAQGSYQDFYLGVYDSIMNGKPAPVTAREGLAVIEIIEAAVKSSKSGVKIDLK